MEPMPMQMHASPGAAAEFLGMWIAMMAAMMLPSLVPMLRRYRNALGALGEVRLAPLTAITGLAYFFVWALFGAAAFAARAALTALEMRYPALAAVLPFAGGAVVLVAGLLQFSRWKAHHLACCRAAPGRGTVPANAGSAWRHGFRLGLHCSQCCFGLMAILLVLGVMDLRAMALVTAAITLERLAPAGARYARLTGAVASLLGLFLILCALAEISGLLGQGVN